MSLIPIVAILAGIAGAGTAGAAAAPPARASGERKLDPFLRRVANGVQRTQGLLTDRLPARSRAAARTLPPFLRAERDRDDPLLYVNARVAAGADLEGLLAAGATVRGRAGDIVSLAVPASALTAVADRPEVAWLRAARSFALMNDVSTAAPLVASRVVNSTMGGSGQGVIVAVVDTGIDIAEDDFRNPDGTTRILGLWDQTITDVFHPPPPGFNFGAFYSQADIAAVLLGAPALITRDGHGHGTHVTGTAAGNGRHTGNGYPQGTFAGVAPMADILVVRVFDDGGVFCNACDLVAAVQFIDGFAKAAGKPWVGNMSLGDDVGGAHDGSSAEELAIDAVVGPGHPGAQMAVAAGNSGSSGRHFHWENSLGLSETWTNTFNPGPGNPIPGDDNEYIVIDLWYEGEDAATVDIVTPAGTVVSAPIGVDTGIVCTTSGAVQVDASNVNDPENHDNQVFIEITDSSACSPVVAPATGTWTLRVSATAVGPLGGGQFDAWNIANARGAGGFVNFANFSPASTVSVPGTVKNGITAGAYVSKTTWINGTGGTVNGLGTLGARATFSGSGPTRDDRIKPDISGPGQTVGSSMSSVRVPFVPAASRERDNVHYGMSGTSMATPHVAGTMALLLSLDPTLDGAQVKAALQRGAASDMFTGALPNNGFGWGKLRALDAAYDTAAMAPGLAADLAGGFTWGNEPTVTRWNVYRAPIPGLSASDYGTCLQSGLLAPGFSDPASPPLGQAFAYFVAGVYTRPWDGSVVEGILGTTSTGAVRPNISPCP